MNKLGVPEKFLWPVTESKFRIIPQTQTLALLNYYIQTHHLLISYKPRIFPTHTLIQMAIIIENGTGTQSSNPGHMHFKFKKKKCQK